MKRRERRELARKNKVAFEPKYNGRKPQTYEEFYGVGYERFNSKYVNVFETK